LSEVDVFVICQPRPDPHSNEELGTRFAPDAVSDAATHMAKKLKSGAKCIFEGPGVNSEGINIEASEPSIPG
jgi:hypothetical protein